MKKKPARDKKLEVRFAKAELEVIRKKFGRAAASVARDFLLAYRVTNPNPPNKRQMAAFLRAFVLHRHQAVALRRRITSQIPHDSGVATILQREEQLYNELTHEIVKLWSVDTSD